MALRKSQHPTTINNQFTFKTITDILMLYAETLNKMGNTAETMQYQKTNDPAFDYYVAGREFMPIPYDVLTENP